MVKELLLPNRAAALESQVDLPGGSTLNGFHDLGQAIAPAILAAARGIDQMHVIRHHDGSVQIEFVSVLSYTAFKNNISARSRKLPAPVRGEGDEERMIVFLIVR